MWQTAPAGYVVTHAYWGKAAEYLCWKALQVLVNGSWLTVSQI